MNVTQRLSSGQCKQSKLQAHGRQGPDKSQVCAHQYGLPKQRRGDMVAGRSGSAPLLACNYYTVRADASGSFPHDWELQVCFMLQGLPPS